MLQHLRTASQYSTSIQSLALLAAVAMLWGCSSSDDDSEPAAGGNGTTATGGSNGSGTGGSGTTTGGTDGSGGSSAVAGPQYVGSFDVRLTLPASASGTPGSTTISGSVREGPPLQEVIWELADAAGDCELHTPRVPFCDPVCEGGAICVEDGQCATTPATHSVGTVTISGVQTTSGTQVTMDPMGANAMYVGSASYPPFAEGDAVELSAAGADYPAFSISTVGIAPLALATGDVSLAPDQPVTLTWTPAANPSASQIEVEFDLSHHGGVKGRIRCSTQDTGSLEVDASLITQLIALGFSGWPDVRVERNAIGTTEIEPGPVQLAVRSSDVRAVQLPGLISCSDDSDCPAGQTCADDLQCE